jgi:hypothetical protein
MLHARLIIYFWQVLNATARRADHPMLGEIVPTERLKPEQLREQIDRTAYVPP